MLFFMKKCKNLNVSFITNERYRKQEGSNRKKRKIRFKKYVKRPESKGREYLWYIFTLLNFILNKKGIYL